ncbi:putative thymocyte nuclear protein 1 protein [Eutypa lata UCREL1]|uniref:Thymocyte nuclear protein 1 n=1 Tax=Eutypa lata (strain UCR-EL1) TaxID=1287681 RepID=M7T837_EUTLA|nr:putative thymocyte nuclear protein 1 protein [Eutypa lata UCREL1]
MPKRKAAQLDAAEPEGALRRSTRRKSQAPTAIVDESKDVAKSKTTSKSKAVDSNKSKKRTKDENSEVEKPTSASASTSKVKAETKPPSKVTKAKGSDTAESTANGSTADSPEKWYWLMKAEPESRFENGTDVRFSIDDLASRTEPEPWDGIRNYVARNNLRAMKKGELAFFYHSNCKEPGIVGTMEIVEEHSPDLSAHDSKAPYYDASSKPDKPKWSVVHVRFRSKFAKPIGLKELREMGKLGQPLENMQMLKQSRLSVSRVSPTEWDYLMSVANDRGGETG